MFCDNEFGAKIRELRLICGMSQKDVATYIGVTPTQISDIEKGKTSTTLKRAVLLAELFNVSLDWLAGVQINEPQQEDSFQIVFNSLSSDQQQRVIGYMDSLTGR